MRPSSIKDRDHGRIRIVCTSSKEGGTCINKRPYYLENIERSVVVGLREKLVDREAIALFVRTYNDERRRLAAETSGSRTKIETRLAAAERDLERTVANLVKGRITEEEADAHLPMLRTEVKDLKVALAGMAAPSVVSLHPAAIEKYVADLGELADAINAGAEHGELSIQALRDLVNEVVVQPRARGEQVTIDIRGRLAKLVDHDMFPQSRIRGVHW